MTSPLKKLRSVVGAIKHDTARWDDRISSMEACQLSSLDAREGLIPIAPSRVGGPEVTAPEHLQATPAPRSFHVVKGGKR